MTLTELEIFHQPMSLKRTQEYLLERAQAVSDWLAQTSVKRVIFTGCGSSYSLCRSAEAAFHLRSELPALSIPAGDLFMNFQSYANLMEGSTLVILSRSGSTTEAVEAAKLALVHGARLLSVIACEGSPLTTLKPGLVLEIPWAFDRSVCQTQTVSNLYLAAMMIVGIISGDEGLQKGLADAGDEQDDFLNAWSGRMRELAGEPWDRAVVLADGELCGIAEEGALAFNEICRRPSNYYHVLDVRHGPMVLVGPSTLVVVATPSGGPLLDALIADIKAKGARVLLVGANLFTAADIHVPVAEAPTATLGLRLIALMQMLCLYKALDTGANPDFPEGLCPWIRLQVQ